MASCGPRARSTRSASSRASPRPPRRGAARRRPPIRSPPDDGDAHSRRGLLRRAATALVGIAGASLLADTTPATAVDGRGYYTFCGHTYTTGSCPHPTGLPRVDLQGYPLRASDGHPVDDLGRPIDKQGLPIGPDGKALRDPDGRLLSPAPRTRVCLDAVPERFGFKTQIDGSWYRCCGGHVRRLIDCCSYHQTRINGDAALVGYCYHGRKVFCVMYYDTTVTC